MPRDITARVREVCEKMGAPDVGSEREFALPTRERHVVTPPHPLLHKTASVAKEEAIARREGRWNDKPERMRIKVFSRGDIVVGQLGSDMRRVEQLVDSEQGKALGSMVRYCFERDALASMTVREMVDMLLEVIDRDGLSAVSGGRFAECGLALPRRQEIYACLNRLRVRD